MAQIINEMPSVGALLGQGLGQGLNTGLQQIADFKIKQLMARQQAASNQALLQALTGGQNQQEQYNTSQMQQQMMGQQGQDQLPDQQTNQQQYAQQEDVGSINPQASEALGYLSPHDVIGLSKGLNTEKYRSKQLEADANKFNYQVNKTYIDTVKTRSHRAKDDIVHLQRMKKLFEEGDVRDPRISTLFDYFGINYDALKNGDTSEIEKLQTRLLGGAQGTFGGRVTNYQTGLYAKGIPSYLNSAEAAVRLVDQLIKTKEYEMNEGKVLDNFLQHGKVPFDLQTQVDRQLEPMYKKYASDYINAPTSNQKSFEALPDATLYDGKKIMDESSGKILVSYKGKWVPQDKIPKG